MILDRQYIVIGAGGANAPQSGNYNSNENSPHSVLIDKDCAHKSIKSH
jgi:hypothetical protein